MPDSFSLDVSDDTVSRKTTRRKGKSYTSLNFDDGRWSGEASLAPGSGNLPLPHPGGVGVSSTVEHFGKDLPHDDSDSDEYFQYREKEDQIAAGNNSETATALAAAAEVKKPKKKAYPYKRLVELARSERKALSWGIVALIFSSLATMAVPYLAGTVLDSALTLARYNGAVANNVTISTTISKTDSAGAAAAVVNDEEADAARAALREVALVIGILVLLSSIGAGFRAYLFTLSGERVVLRLRRQLLNSLVVQDVGFFDRTKTGELLNRLSSDCTVLQNTVTVNVSMGLRSVVQLVGGIAMIFYISWDLTLVMLATVPIIVILSVVYGKWVKKISKAFQTALAKTGEVASDALSNARVVRSFGQERVEMARYAESIEVAYRLAQKRSFGYGTLMSGTTLFGNVALGAVLWYGGGKVVDGSLTVGSLSSFVIYAVMVGAGIGMITSLYSDIMKSVGASHRVFALIDRKAKVRWTGRAGAMTAEPVSAADTARIRGHLVLDHVSFHYPSRPDVQVLKDVSLTLEPGKVVALVGTSGGGKSTCVALMNLFYYPTAGRILLDGEDTRDIDPSILRRNIASVSQEPVLFATSIRENISYGKIRVSADGHLIQPPLEDVIAAAKVAHCHDFISAFPDGYETLVGERGVRLSGGQKQRIAIARAVMMDPAVLLLDEATSALDAESEYAVQVALDELIQGRTVLVVAHRLSTVKSADSVIVVDGGEIIEQGTHDELIQRPEGMYKQLVKRQLQHSEAFQ